VWTGRLRVLTDVLLSCSCICEQAHPPAHCGVNPRSPATLPACCDVSVVLSSNLPCFSFLLAFPADDGCHADCHGSQEH
jgi:hypothetical protein